MPEYEKTLIHSEVQYGLIAHYKLKEHFAFGQRLELIDQDGRSYHLNLHLTRSRIDRLTEWHRRYNTSVGDTLSISIKDDNRIYLRVIKSDDIQTRRERIRISVAAGVYKTIDDLLPPSTTTENLLTTLRIVDEEMHLVQPSVVERMIRQTIRNDSRMIHLLRQLAGHRCQFPGCGVSILKKDGSHYTEVAHLRPVHLGGKSVLGNLLVLCPNHHKELDLGNITIKEQTIHRVTGVLNGKPFMIALGSLRRTAEKP